METDRALCGVLLAAMTYNERVAYLEQIENALVRMLALAPGEPIPKHALEEIVAECDELAAGKSTR